MITRRGFLETSLVTLVLPVTVQGRAASGPKSNISARIIAISGCLEGERFCNALRAPADRIDSDVGPVLQALANDADDFPVYLGLTRDSDYLLIRQVLIERYFREVYRGQHHTRSSLWSHSLAADANVVASLSTALMHGGSNWGKQIAANAPFIAASANRSIRRTITTPRNEMHSGATQLVSWAFRSAGVAS